MNVLLREFGIFLQEIYLDSKKIELIVDQSNYRNLNIASKRIIQLSREMLEIRNIDEIKITYQIGNVKILSVDMSSKKFMNFLKNKSSFIEFQKSVDYQNYQNSTSEKIFSGVIDYPILSWELNLI